MLVPAELEFKYSFIKVRKEKESILMGINPTNKHQHELLKTIKNQNTVQNATKGLLFSPTETSYAALQMDTKTAITNLNQLINSQFTVQVPCFEFDQVTKQLTVNYYFITNTPEDKMYSMYNIFDELIIYSYNSIKSWYETRELMTNENFKKELSWQFQARQNESYKGVTSFFSPLKKFLENKNGIIVHDDMMEYISRELVRRLIDNGIGREVTGYGVIMLKSSEVLEAFEAASQFLREKILPTSKSEQSFKFRVDHILFEEKAHYQVEKFPKKTTRFNVALAKEVKELKTQSGKGSYVYPGALTVETILKMEDIAEERYEALWKEECTKIRQEFKKNLIANSNKWSNLILFLSHVDSLNYHPDVWKEIINDQDIIYSKWQVPKNTYFVFTGKEPAFFRNLVLGMVGLSDSELWRAEALKNQIEKNERRLKNILNDKNFSTVYSQLIRKIYSQYIPWYQRILMLLPFQTFQTAFFESAQSKIDHTQNVLSSKNESYNNKAITDLQLEKTKALGKLREDMMDESIRETLDLFYFSMKKIPTLNEVKQYFPDEEIFMKTINSKKFRIMNLTLKNGDHFDALVYPNDKDWDEKKSQLTKSLDAMVNERNPHISQSFDKVRAEKAQKLLVAIEKE